MIEVELFLEGKRRKPIEDCWGRSQEVRPTPCGFAQNGIKIC